MVGSWGLPVNPSARILSLLILVSGNGNWVFADLRWSQNDAFGQTTVTQKKWSWNKGYFSLTWFMHSFPPEIALMISCCLLDARVKEKILVPLWERNKHAVLKYCNLQVMLFVLTPEFGFQKQAPSENKSKCKTLGWSLELAIKLCGT